MDIIKEEGEEEEEPFIWTDEAIRRLIQVRAELDCGFRTYNRGVHRRHLGNKFLIK